MVHLNNLLAKKQTELVDQINVLEEKNKLRFMSIKDLKAHLSKTSSKLSFFEYAQKLIDELTKSQRFGNAKIYKCVFQAVKKFHPYEHLKFEEINYQFLKRMEVVHFKKVTSVNGLAVYMKTIRAIYNRAIKDNIITKEAYPFQDYKIKTEPTAKRAISKDKIRSIMDLKLQPTDALFDARNYFLASYLMNGMSFTDMAHLKRENIVDGRIRYRRQKTAKLYDLKVTEQLSVILSYYIEDKSASDFIFPIIKSDTAQQKYKDVKWGLNQYNKRLLEIAKKCNIEEHLTSYVSRHSMATHLILSDVPINALSKMLGHTKLSTTQIYIKDLPTNVLDDYQERLRL